MTINNPEGDLLLRALHVLEAKKVLIDNAIEVVRCERDEQRLKKMEEAKDE